MPPGCPLWSSDCIFPPPYCFPCCWSNWRLRLRWWGGRWGRSWHCRSLPSWPKGWRFGVHCWRLSRLDVFLWGQSQKDNLWCCLNGFHWMTVRPGWNYGQGRVTDPIRYLDDPWYLLSWVQLWVNRSKSWAENIREICFELLIRCQFWQVTEQIVILIFAARLAKYAEMKAYNLICLEIMIIWPLDRPALISKEMTAL